MRKHWILALTLCCILLLSGCSCEHQWKDADCTTPKTCTLCGEIEGAPLGHVWAAATCTTPKTCTVCGLTEGEANGHTWTEANCTTAKTCSVCHSVEGEALGHDWQDATTEAPKTCSHCGLTEGERIITDDRFTTSACKDLFGTWSGTVDMDASDLGIGAEQYFDTVSYTITIEFRNDGTGTLISAPSDEKQAYELVFYVSRELIYAEFSALGLSKDQADTAFYQTYGMTVDQYITQSMSDMDVSASLTESGTVEFVYYADSNHIYMGSDWNEDLEANEFTLSADQLSLQMDADSNNFATLTREKE